MTLLRLLALLLYAALAMTDPYRPFPATPTRVPVFPRERLTRAGLDEDTVGRLESEFDALDPAGRAEFGGYVTAHSDDAIRQRYTDGDAGQSEQPGQPEQPEQPAASPTYEELNALTVDELDDRLREWNDTHPDQHLTIAGRKGEKIGRLLDAYEGEQGAATPEAAPPGVAEPGPEQPVEQQIPTAPTATTPEGAPAVPVTPPGTVETGDASTGAQAPAQTTDADTGAGPTT